MVILNLVVQKALQVTSGLKFLEIIESIKKTIKNLKQTNHGKKIYENIMSNYGVYFNLTKNTAKKNTTSAKNVPGVIKDKNVFKSLNIKK
jgi:hypothetical protein